MKRAALALALIATGCAVAEPVDVRVQRSLLQSDYRLCGMGSQESCASITYRQNWLAQNTAPPVDYGPVVAGLAAAAFASVVVLGAATVCCGYGYGYPGYYNGYHGYGWHGGGHSYSHHGGHH